MSDATGLLLILGVLLLLIFLGYPIAFAMLVTGILAIYLIIGGKFIGLIERTLWEHPNSFTMTAVPLYLFMGEILFRIGISDRLYRGVTPWLQNVPGSLLHTNIGACAIFAAICGSSLATAATIGTIAIPEMERRRYDARLTLGSVAAGGTLGILIPPSIMMIFYASITGESVGQLFLGGVIPGVTLALLFMLYVGTRVVLNPKLAPPREPAPWRERLAGLLTILPIAALIFMVLGTIYLGVATATEAAALGAAFSLILGLIYRTLTWGKLKEAMIATTRTTASLMFIFVTAVIPTAVLAYMGVHTRLAAWILSLALPPLMFMVLVYIMFLILGCFLPALPMMLLTLPWLMPVIETMGFDPVWFGIVMVILIECAELTPPVGMNLFVIQGVAPKYSFGDIVSGALPFFYVMLVMIALLTAFPALALWLPGLMIR
ncbi:MAG: TRAP transporter large permease [Chloroflexota bacterium]